MTENLAFARDRPRKRIMGWIIVIALTCVAALFIWGVIVILGRAEAMKRRAACTANLKDVATALLVYAEASKGGLPQSLDVLTASGPRAFLQPRQLACPESGKPYTVIIGQSNGSDPRSILLYEAEENHGVGTGRNTAYADGHVVWCTNEKFLEDLEATLARLRSGSTATTPE